MIDQGVTVALAARDALRSTNGDDSHNSETGVRRTERATRECTYTDFLKSAYGMTQKTLMKMMTDKYCPRNEIRKLEMELWELKVKGTDLASYTQRFQELALLCRRVFSEEADKIKKYVGASSEKKQYGGSRPLCAKCNYHHDGPCAPKCRKCNKIGHSTRDCRSVANTNNANNQRGTGLGQNSGCYECGIQGHFKRECPKLKNNNNQGNQSRRNNALARVYIVGHTGTDSDANVVT
nr:hypothetical protein [Tanacetum cinerariifolium]